MLMDNGTIEMDAITYIRGRSINNAIIILEEAQNISVHEMKTILTRIGKGTKIVINGDVSQVDRSDVDSISNGLSVIIEKFKSYSISGNTLMLEGVRSPLSELAANIL
jgi:PhoH-like ATPase